MIHNTQREYNENETMNTKRMYNKIHVDGDFLPYIIVDNFKISLFPDIYTRELISLITRSILPRHDLRSRKRLIVKVHAIHLG